MYTRDYLIRYYAQLGFKFHKIKWGKKPDGDQIGATVDFSYQDESDYVSTSKFYIKTHECGSSSRSRHGDVVDPREIWVYSFLELVGLGAEVHFYFHQLDRRNVYIASKEVACFETFDFACNRSDFIKEFKNDETYTKCLIYVELIGKMLCLNDINNNLGNFGLISPVSSYLDIRLVDFFICSVFIDQDMLEKFKKPDISLSHKEHDLHVFFKVTKERKSQIAKEILTDLLNRDVNFFKKSCKKASERTSAFLAEYERGIKSNELRNEYDRKCGYYNAYLSKIDENISKFINHFCFQ